MVPAQLASKLTAMATHARFKLNMKMGSSSPLALFDPSYSQVILKPLTPIGVQVSGLISGSLMGLMNIG